MTIRPIFTFMYCLLAILFTSVAIAEQPSIADITPQLQKLSNTPISIDKIAPTPIPGLYEITVGASIFYTTADGNYLLYGQLLDLSKTLPRNLTEEVTRTQRLKLIAAIDEASMIVFKPKNTTHTITVFTDIDCPYCRELHKEIPDLIKAGIKVRYLAFPRTGIDSPSYNKAIAVWCAPDRQQALTDAKRGKSISPASKNCQQDKTIRRHLQLVQDLDLRVTPVIVLENGELVSGYLPAKKLIKRIEGA